MKVVVFHKSDIDWSKEHAQKVSDSCMLYMQPEWSKREAMQPIILDFIRVETKWRISVQTHKYLGVD